VAGGERDEPEDHRRAEEKLIVNFLKQTIAVTMLNLRTIPQRLGSSGVAIVGIAGVVIVLVSVLSIAQGFTAAMEQSGADNRALVMRSGADSEMTSGLGGPEVDIIKQAPGMRREGQTPLASAELYVIIDLPKKSTPDSPANVPLRGVEPTVLKVRDEVSVIEGRMLQFGTNEVIVGRGAQAQFMGLNLGADVKSGQNVWRVVGVFEADGGVAETEVWADSRTLQGVYRRGNSYQSVLARLDSTDSLTAFRDWLTANPQLNVMVRRENEYYAGQSQALTRLIQTIGFGIAALMGLGAVFGAILTMYTAVATRAREIATLRALGFNSLSVVVSVLTESLALGALGGLIGGLAAYIAFNGYQTSTMNFQTFSQVAFAFRVTPQLLMLGLAYALIMGLVGGLLPAIRAARLPIPSALREL
jgi:putative ABC transport system permease protein